MANNETFEDVFKNIVGDFFEKSKRINLSNHISTLDGEIIKGAWVAPPHARYGGKDYITDEAFQDVKNSGVNLLFGVIDPTYEFDDLCRFLNMCDKYGLYTIVPEESLGKPDCDTDAIIKRLSYYKAMKCVVGINMRDEPGWEHIPVFKANLEKIKPHLGDLLVYLNHMPMYAKDTQIFGGDYHHMQKEITEARYRQFLEGYNENVDVDILSYDFYPFRHEKGIIDPKYYKQLCIFREFAEKYNRPFWNFTQVTSWSRVNIRNMTYSEIEWLNNTSVACGAAGLAYFCYWTPNSKDEHFENAMVAPNGVKTQSYYFVQRANNRLDRAISYIKNSKYVGAIPYGDTMALFPEDVAITEFGDLVGVNSDGTLVGCFKEGEKNRYYIVNTSVFETRTVELYFKKPVDVFIVDGADVKTFTGTQTVLTIDAGQAVVVADK